MQQTAAWKTDPSTLAAERVLADPADIGDIAWDDHKIAFVIPFVRDKDVLDIGAVDHHVERSRSRYWLHRALHEKAGSLVGMDLYANGVHALRGEGYNVVVGDAQNFAFDQQFDVIVAGDVLAHLEDLNGFVSCSLRHLRAGGRLLVSTPNPWYWRNVARAAFRMEACMNPEQTNWLCAATLRQLVERHGMRVHGVKFGSRYLRDRLMPLPAGWKHTSLHFEIGFDDPIASGQVRSA